MKKSKVPNIKAIQRGCEKAHKELCVRIRVDDVEKDIDKEDYIEAKHKQLVEFGYGTLTVDHVREQLDAVLAGKSFGKGGLTVIGMFMQREVVR